MSHGDLFTGERFVPGIDDVKLEAEHYHRYMSVCGMIKGKIVLDAACGEGYGSNILSVTAKRVIGIDLNQQAIGRAKERYKDRENLKFIQGSIENIELDDHSVDVVVSFETIEHVAEPIQEKFLDEIYRILKKDGILIMSTPNKKIYSDLRNYDNPYHVKEFYYDEFIDFIRKRFQQVQIFCQSFQVTSIIENNDLPDEEMICIKRQVDEQQKGKYFIAVAGNEKNMEVGISSAYIYDHDEYEANIDRILALQDEEEERNQHIQKLDALIERLNERERARVIYRLAKRIQKVFEHFFPQDSIRRFFTDILFDAVKHPQRMLRLMSLRRIRNCLRYMKTEGIDDVKKRYTNILALDQMCIGQGELVSVELLDNIEKEDMRIGDFEKIVIPVFHQPTVSIVIPVYNEFNYTYNCLQSICKNSGNVPYEIIIANDCSIDITNEIEKVVKNIRMITTKENTGFLRNCNYAARYTKGKYILFLNNDTQVQKNWLEPLVSLMDMDDSIGMAGSRLVYPDGFLQEAGGIVWKDASAWNYGHGKGPGSSEYSYVKEADYISGASIIIRRELWNEIGGFDERFVPAYYEDTDLAFEVRKRGYKVMYQPNSVVVHFEGVSNGTDVECGLKQYQVENRQKFYEKWRSVLEKDHEPNAENVFTARDRSGHKKHILVVDHYVPRHDQDAGGKCTYMYLKLFVKLGLQVTFIGDNFFRHEPYTTELNQMGIEVLYGRYYNEKWKKWLKKNGHYFDYIYLQRPHISVKYIDLVKQYSNAKIFYFAHDLHHIREYREYEITKDPKKLASSQRWKDIEYDLFNKADVGHVVGSYEQKMMQKAFPDKPIRNIPLYIYEQLPEGINKDFSTRNDLLYVGGFGHPPNVDAVLWFAREVFPIILKKYPEMKWHIVGGSVPESVKKLASESIIVEGFVSDDVLEQMYRKSRIAVVPLRFGAGVKGKVVEAAYYQIPLVTTSIGAEGLSQEEGFMIVEDDGKTMADIICDLYEDYDKLCRMSDRGCLFVSRYFMLSEAERVLRLDMDMV